MPRSCVAPGCSEGYGSKTSTLSFFSCPKDPIKKAKWQRAIPRVNFVLKETHVLCEKHFSPDDILRTKIFKDSHGNIIAEANYAKPKLAEDAVPTLFPNCPAYLSKKKPQPRRPITKNNTEPVVQPNISDLAGESESTRGNSPTQPDRSVFELNNLLSVHLPLTWNRSIPISGPKAVFFTQLISYTLPDGKIGACIFKEVCVNNEGVLTCRVLGRNVESALNINCEPLKDCAELSDIIEKVDAASVCEGYVTTAMPMNISSDVCFMDSAGVRRHTNCPLVIATEGVCRHCRQGERTLLQKHLRNTRRTSVKRPT